MSKEFLEEFLEAKFGSMTMCVDCRFEQPWQRHPRPKTRRRRAAAGDVAHSLWTCPSRNRRRLVETTSWATRPSRVLHLRQSLVNVAAVAKGSAATEDSRRRGLDRLVLRQRQRGRNVPTSSTLPTSRQHRRRRQYGEAAAHSSDVEDPAIGSAQARAR
mmetsp:Transcript_3810/g.11844  ORF Transcript_3810/g.11844 Transcript_3810/m.11844 type:complete len:159 (+) Transcript_3810:200-676(+)